MAEYYNENNNSVISGSSEADSIYNGGDTVTINAGAGDDTVENYGSTVTINGGDGNDSIWSNGDYITINGGAGDDFIYTNGNASINFSQGNDTVSLDSGVSSLKVASFTSGDVIQLSYSVDTLTTISGNSFEVNGITVSGLGAATVQSENWSLKSNVASYLVKHSAGATLDEDNETIIYTAAGTNTLLSVDGVKSTVGLDIDTEYKTVTVSADALNKTNVTISNEDYYLELGDDVAATQYAEANWTFGTTAVYRDDSGITDGYEVVDNQIIYHEETLGAVLLELTGVASVGAPTVSGNTVTFAPNSFQANVAVKNIYDEFSFEFDAGEDGENYSSRTFTATANDDTVTNYGSKIKINAGGGSDTITNNGDTVTISGGEGDDSIYNDGSNVSINGGGGSNFIDLQYGSDVTVNVQDGNDTISVGNVDSFTVENFASGDAIQFSYSIDVFETTSGGAVADNITISGLTASTIQSIWDSASGGLTYSENYSAGATLNESKDALVYRTAGASTFFTINGIKSTLGVDIDKENKVVTLGLSALGSASVSINNDFTLELADYYGVQDVEEHWETDGTFATYKDEGTSEGYEADGNKINYTAAVEGNTLLQLGGMKIEVDEETGTDTTPEVLGDTVTLSAENFASNVEVLNNSGSYAFEFAEGNYTGKSFTATSFNDSITMSGGSNILIDAGGGSNFLDIIGTNVTVNTGDGNDSIFNRNDSTSVTIDSGAGNDTIENEANYSTLISDSGNNTLNNSGDGVLIQLGDGSDSIYNGGANVTINAGAGDNFIQNYGESALFEYAGGNVTVEGFDETSILKIMSGTTYTTEDGEVVTLGGISEAYLIESDGATDAVLRIGSNTLTLKNFVSNHETNIIKIKNADDTVEDFVIPLWKGTAEDDYITNYYSDIEIQALEGDDEISNEGANVTINGGDGIDNISNGSDAVNVLISGGGGSNFIENNADNVTIEGGADGDYISNSGSEVSINGGNGINVIELSGGLSVTVNVEEGNDLISVSSAVESFTAEGFGTGDSIQLSDTLEGELVNVGGGVSAGTLKIFGLSTAAVSRQWTEVTNGVASYLENFTEGSRLDRDNKDLIVYTTEGTDTLFTISGISSTVGIDVDYETKIVTLGLSALGSASVSIDNDFTLQLADYYGVQDVDPHWETDGTTATYRDTGTSEGYEADGNKINYTAAVAGATLLQLGGVSITEDYPMDAAGSTVNISAENFASNVSVLNNSGSYAFEINDGDYSNKTFTANELGDTVTNYGSNIILNLGAGENSVLNYAINATINTGDDNDYISNGSDAENVLISSGGGSDTVENFAANVTINAGADDDIIYSSGDNVSINGGAGNDSVEIYGEGIKVNVGEGNDTISVSGGIETLTVENFDSGDLIQLGNSPESLTNFSGGVSAGSLTIFGMSAAIITKNFLLTQSGVATYTENYTEGARLNADKDAIVYTEEGTDTLFTISGISSTVGIEVDNETKIVTLGLSALGSASVSISSEDNLYSLALADDYSPQYIDAQWYTDGTTATYKDSGFTEGYEFDGERINYIASIEGATLLQLGGVSITENYPIDVSGATVMLSPENFADNVTIIKSDTESEFNFTINEGDYSGKTFNGNADDDSVTNNGTNIIFNFGAGNDSIDNFSNSVTIDAGTGDNYVSNYGASVIVNGGEGNDSIYNYAGGENVEINAGGGSNIIENYSASVIINGGDGNDSIYSDSDNVTINLGKGDDTIALNLAINPQNIIQYASGDGNDVIQVSGTYGGANISVELVKGNIGGYSTTEENTLVLEVDDGSITFENADGELISVKSSTGESHVWNGGSNISIDAGEGGNIIENSGTGVTIISGAGDDSVTLSGGDYGGNTFVYSAGDGNDVLYNFTSNDTIKIADDSKVKASVKNNDVVLKIGTSTITVDGAAKDSATISLVNSDEEIISVNAYSTEGTVSEDTIILSSNFKGTYTATDLISKVDGSNVMNKIRINGNESFDNSLVGGKKNDTLAGSIGNDTLTGGKGSDLFIFSGGFDTITDYSSQDKISIGSDLGTETNEIIDNDLILYYDNNSLTITRGANKNISFVENNRTTARYYTTDGVFDGAKKSVTLQSSVESFSAKTYSNLATIDGAATGAIEILGNSKANSIKAGTGNATISGGKGKDTIYGGDGADIFIYAKGDGKDVIQNYGDGDVISLGSGATIKDAKIKRGDSTIKIGSGSITVNDKTEFTLTSSSGNDTVFSNGIFVGEDTAKVLGSFSDTIDLGTLGVSTADASEAKKKVTINGSSSADSILGGKGKDTLLGDYGDDTLEGGKGNDILNGGAGDDSLWGGKGNDTLTGGDGDDTFIFRAGEGNDVITDYAAGDLLQILNRNGRGYADFKSSFSNNTLTLKVNGGGKITMRNISESASVNINGTSRTVSSMI